MRTNILKKIRKRYLWYWNPSINRWVVIDKKKQKVKRYKKANHFIANWVSRNLGFSSFADYAKRVMKREDIIYFNEETKKFAA